MPSWTEIGLAICAGPALWLAGAIFFDFVHWILHGMLRSRWRPLRTLAWPHQVHHEWIDRNLVVHFERQTGNLFCHIVPEYLTQLVFSAGLALLLPWTFVAVLVGLQTLVFAGILHARGLDLNHRPIEWLDAYAPGFLTPPAYHALHHVYPDGHYSAYTKLIDWLVGGGLPFAGRRFAFSGASPFAAALEAELTAAGAIATSAPEADADPALPALRDVDVLVLCAPAVPEAPAVEAFAAVTRGRRLPPEVWVVRASPADPIARHYHADVRVNHRIIVLRDPDVAGPAARRAAHRTLRDIRRGFNFVGEDGPLGTFRQWRSFHRTSPERPSSAAVVRSRAQWAREAAP